MAEQEAPRIVDPIQQTISTTLLGYINSPAVNRLDVKAAIEEVLRPQTGVYIRELKRAYEAYNANHQIADLLAVVIGLDGAAAPASTAATDNVPTSSQLVRREELRLICFDYVWS